MAIPARLCETLREYKAHQDRHASFLGKAWQNLGYVFTEEDGYVMNPQTPTKQFSKFLKRHGIRHLKLHGCDTHQRLCCSPTAATSRMTIKTVEVTKQSRQSVQEPWAEEAQKNLHFK